MLAFGGGKKKTITARGRGNDEVRMRSDTIPTEWYQESRKWKIIPFNRPQLTERRITFLTENGILTTTVIITRGIIIMVAIDKDKNVTVIN